MQLSVPWYWQRTPKHLVCINNQIGIVSINTIKTLLESCSESVRVEAIVGLLTILTPLATLTSIVMDHDLDSAKRIQLLVELFNFAFKQHQQEGM